MSAPEASAPRVEVRGDATAEEVAAIVAVVEATWPQPVVVAAEHPAPRWRFSGRWWTKPIPTRRIRP